MNQDYLKIGAHFPTGNPYLNIDSRERFTQKMGTLNYSVEDKVKYCLSLFGWTGEKRPEAKSVIRDMEHYNYYIFPAARIFLERFAGLQIEYEFPTLGESTKLYTNIFPHSFNIYDFVFYEGLQIFKNELLVPIMKTWDMYILLGESGRVHYWNCDNTTGILREDLFSVFYSRLFLLERSIWFRTTKKDRQEVSWWDDDLMGDIEAQVNEGTYVSYAQKRFAKNNGVPNPLVGKDPFTQWLLTLDQS